MTRPLRTIVVLLVLTAAALAGEDNPFRRTFQGPDEAMKAMKEREPSAPKAGDPAPDFELSDPAGAAATRLSSFAGKSPVVLIFGSYT